VLQLAEDTRIIFRAPTWSVCDPVVPPLPGPLGPAGGRVQGGYVESGELYSGGKSCGQHCRVAVEHSVRDYRF